MAMRRVIVYCVMAAIGISLIVGVSACGRRGVSPEKKEAEKKMPARLKREPKAKTKRPRIEKLQGELDIRNAFVEVADEVGKAVVTISTERTQKAGFQGQQFRSRRFGFGGPFEEEDPIERFFEEFFGRFPDREFKQRGLGSGFIIDKEGHVLTNHHVVEGADKINITLPDGRNFEGKLKGADPMSDLAVIEIKAKDLPAVELGDSNLIQVGEWVVALGNPFGHVLRSPKPTVTVGVVSALHRQIPTPGGERGYLDMIQTDAAINPGNSGGPLCDLNGKVIGINVAIFSTSGGYQGMGFAIPINEAKQILKDLIKGKEIAYGWLGVSVQEITPEIATYFNLRDNKGALVSQIAPASPAEKAGLKEGDIITAIDGKEVLTLHDLLREIGNKGVGQRIRVDVVRDRVKKTIEAVVEKRPSRAELAEGGGFAIPEESKIWRGIKVTNVTDDIAGQLGLANREGVVIIDIDRGDAGYAAGLRRGDVIREINRTKIKNVADYQKITGEAKGLVLVRTERGYFTVDEK